MSQLVNITIELQDKEQSHHLEKYLRENMFVGYKITYNNIANTKELYEKDATYRKLVKNHKASRLELEKYINENN